MTDRPRLFPRQACLVLGAALLIAGCVPPPSESGSSTGTRASSSPSSPAAAAAAGAHQTPPAQSGGSVIKASVSTGSLEAAPVAPNAGPRLGTTVFEAPGITPGQPTGTVVGQKVQELRAELERMQARMASHNQQLQQERRHARDSAGSYHGLVGAINTRLQVGSTPGNPELVAAWGQAQDELNQVGASISRLNTLANEASATSALATFLLDSTHATLELRGAVEEDHRQLAVLEDEVNKTLVVVDRLLNEVSEDVARAQNYYITERSNLTAMQVAIDSGEFIGGSLASRAYGVPPPPPAGGGAALVGQRQPLVVIRFERDRVEYEQALFNAISKALERRPNAGFDLVGVAPGDGSPAQVSMATNKSRRYAEQVLRSLTTMGLPADRVTLSAAAAEQAKVNEVHVYVR